MPSEKKFLLTFTYKNQEIFVSRFARDEKIYAAWINYKEKEERAWNKPTVIVPFASESEYPILLKVKAQSALNTYWKGKTKEIGSDKFSDAKE